MCKFTRWKRRTRGLGGDSHIDVSVLFFQPSSELSSATVPVLSWQNLGLSSSISFVSLTQEKYPRIKIQKNGDIVNQILFLNHQEETQLQAFRKNGRMKAKKVKAIQKLSGSFPRPIREKI